MPSPLSMNTPAVPCEGIDAHRSTIPFHPRPHHKLTTLPSSHTGRIENRIFLILYLLTLPFQLLTTVSVLQQCTKALVIITAIHAGLVAALFWGLLANALVATQVVEDGTASSLVVSYVIVIIATRSGLIEVALRTAVLLLHASSR
jgi:hypothetical protein